MIGKTLSHYKILEQIGAGGMGVVYRAHDERLGRDVALKLLPAETLGSESARRQLENEARTASALNHPHICTIHDVGEAEGHFFVAMEYVEGKPLARLIPAGGLPEEMVVRYGMQIADALAHAQERGIVHRDLKSANVVVTPEGRAKVLDFGLAQRVRKEELEEVTRSKVSIEASRGIAGTLAYMAPETLRGEAADARSDIWALGVMLHEMGSGELPFQSATGFELSAAILREPPRPLPARVPAGLRGVIQRCLAKEPGQRYQRASEVKAALEAIGSGSVAAPVPEPHATFWRNAIFGSAGVLALAALLLAFNVGGARERLLGRTGPPQIKAIAVLPLENLSRDPEQEYFADGMTEALISNLAQIGALKVTSRTSVMQYKDARKSLPQIAKELGVDAVVEGSVQRAGDRVKITAQLIHAATDTHLWAREYERDLRDVLTLQSEVARAIAGEIRVKLTPDEQTRLATSRPVHPEAYDAYLRGRYFFNQFPGGLTKSLEHFKQATRLDPQYAPAYAGLNDALMALQGYGNLRAKEAMPQARAAAQKALELDPELAEAHTALAHNRLYYDWDWAAAEREFRRGIELGPNNTWVLHSYANFLAFMKRHDEAISVFRHVVELAPLDPMNHTELGYHGLIMAGRYDEGIHHLRRALELDPNHALARHRLGSAYWKKGMRQEALAEFERAAKLSPETGRFQAVLGQALAATGRKKEAQRILRSLQERSREGISMSYELALVSVGLGDKDQAFAYLEKAFEERCFLMAEMNTDPHMDDLRSDPRFQALLERMKFPKEREK